jgi:serine/threonine protein kinase
MPSDSIAGFLDDAQANRVLIPEQVQQLIRQPDIPQSDLESLCEYLLSRGVVTRFQATAIRQGRGQELNFAGYPVIDEIGPCPGGTAYKALHPSLRTPLELRRIDPDWLAPLDNVVNYINRARSIGMSAHANMVPLIDAGISRDEPYLVLDPPADSADLATLAVEVGGAMPGFLAAEYGRSIAAVLRMAHERGGAHGEVRPQLLLVGPLTTKTANGKTRRRPAPNAVVRLAELGLIPIRPPARVRPPSMEAAPYLPPECVEAAWFTPTGDIYGLGATLYFLLSGRPPFAGETVAEVLSKVASAEPTSLSVLRPDLPGELVELVQTMMHKSPGKRPQTAMDVEVALNKFCRHSTIPQAAVPLAAPASGALASPVMVVYPVGADVAQAEAVVPAEPVEAWGVSSDTFSQAHAEAAPTPRKREMSAQEKGRSRMLLVLGGLLHLTALTLIIAWIAGAFSSTPEPEPSHKQDKNEKQAPQKKHKRQAQPN